MDILMVQEIAIFLLKATAFYFLSINLVYGVLMILSWIEVRRFKKTEIELRKTAATPGISFIIPVFNEETLIVETIQTYLSLPQSNKEIIVSALKSTPTNSKATIAVTSNGMPVITSNALAPADR